MKQMVLSFLIGIFFLTACGQTTAVPSIPSATPTASITPLPTIPTFTPTFDPSTIVTVTPAPQAECPKEDSSLIPDFQIAYYSDDADKKIPEFLNKGGSINVIVDKISKVYSEHSYRLIDVTNDEIPELTFDGFTGFYDTFYILQCQNGHYVVFSGQDVMGVSEGFNIYNILDTNKNSLPEIVIYTRGCTGNGCYRFFIGEWNGKTFVNLAPNIYLEGVNEEEIEIKDINNDGTLELILIGGSYDFKAPWRQSIHTYIWNGNNFVEQPIEYVQPIFRFQAIQDADTAVLIGKYDRAIQLYQEAISNQSLEWWSVERQKYEQDIIDAQLTEPTPSVKPIEDKTEYSRLAAYAYYRIILLHLAQNHASDANTTYNTLQQQFGTDQYARPYVEMATAFWEAYQSAYKMYDGCAATIQYAVEHPEILIPLGSDYHGSQSHIYVPEDVCPFR